MSTTSSATAPNAGPLVRRSAALTRRLAGARRSLLAIEFARRLATSLALVVAYAAALMTLDWLFEFPLEVRRVTSWVGVALGATALLWTLVSLITQRRDDEEIALMVEREGPAFDSRLIGAVQFAEGHAAVPDGAPAEMVQAMVAETEREASAFPFSSIVEPKHFARAALCLLAVLVVSGIGALSSGDLFAVLLDRALGKERAIPRQTKIVDQTGELRVGIGDRVELRFLAEGVLPDEGQLFLRYASGRNERVPLSPSAEETGAYLAAVEDVPDSFSFRARINDAETDWAEVTALERPEVATISATQTYPEFTGLPPSEHAPGDFALFPGSEVSFVLRASKALQSAGLGFVNTGESLAMEIDASDPQIARAKFAVPPDELGGFTVALVDSEQMDSKDNTVYRVTPLADRAPEVRIIYPRRAEELVTRRARVLLRFEATDRFGVSTVNLRFARGDESDVGTLPIPVPDGAPQTVAGDFDWELAKLDPAVTEGDVIEFWLEASDQNSAGSNVGSSEHLFLKVVTPEEKRADLLGRASDAIGGVGEATADQERINQDLEKLIRDSAVE